MYALDVQSTGMRTPWTGTKVHMTSRKITKGVHMIGLATDFLGRFAIFTACGQSNFIYKYNICKLNSIYSNVIICFILTPFLILPSKPILPSPLKLQNFKTPNESLISVCCVCVQIWHVFHIRDRKYIIEINFCVFNLMIILLLPSYIFLFMNALKSLPFNSNVQR